MPKDKDCGREFTMLSSAIDRIKSKLVLIIRVSNSGWGREVPLAHVVM
jgi:hypothetical protein